MSQIITSDIQNVFEPQAAIIAYSRRNGYDTEYFLESRAVRENGTLGPGKPVTIKFVKELVSSMKTTYEIQPYGPIPANMLYADNRIGSEKYVWWNPPQKRPMYFNGKMAMPDDNYNMPGVVYMVKGSLLFVYCFKGRKPTGETDLLMGPFFNYYEDCHMCLGSARVEWPSVIMWEDVQKHWEKMFWMSVNTHSMANPMNEGAILTVALKDSLSNPFNTELLKKTNRKLKDLLR